MPFDIAAARRLLADPSLTGEERSYVEEQLRVSDGLLERNPLLGFFPHACRWCKQRGPNPGCEKHREPQRDFLAATTKVQAAFAGNRFGKTTALVAKLLIQHAPPDMLPAHLRGYRFTRSGFPIMGRLLIPSEKALVEYTIPAFKEWTPREMFQGGTWDSAYDKKHNILRFADGLGQIGIYTYNQDPETMVGAALDYAAYDEPPPQPVRNETIIRLVDRDGPEIFALTPVNMKGGGIGWLRREIWKKRESPSVTVVKASIYDNPLLSRSAIEHALAAYPEEERQARAEGDFMHFGGMIYEDGFEKVLVDPLSPERVKGWDIVVGIDPGLKNCALTWVGFDNDNRAVAFDEVRLQDKTPADYAKALRAVNKKWGITDPLYVIDPSARNRSLTNAESVESLLTLEGIYCMHGQNEVQAGIQQVRVRVQRGMFFCARNCMWLRDEAEEYRSEDRPDGEFKPVKERDHQLDSLRYALMARLWEPGMEPAEPEQPLGWRPGFAPSLEEINRMYVPPMPPMGVMS